MIFVAAAAATSAAPFSFEAAPGRLPKEVVPTDYAIAVVPDIGAGTLAGTERVIARGAEEYLKAPPRPVAGS